MKILPYTEFEAYFGLSNLSHAQRSFQDSRFHSTPGYGVSPRVNSSHKVTPKLHTSDLMENVRSRRLSIAIHLSGKGHCKINFQITQQKFLI